jgi:hypothetical protein
MKIPFLGVTITASAVLGTVAGIVITGLLLDEAGKGKFGEAVKKVSQKITNGYGV